MLDIDYDAAAMRLYGADGQRLLVLRIRPDGSLDADYRRADLTGAARALLTQLRELWAGALGPDLDTYPVPAALARMFTARADDWWSHHVALSTTMRVPRPDLGLLGNQLAGLFPTIEQEYIAAPAPPRQWSRRLVAHTAAFPCAPPAD